MMLHLSFAKIAITTFLNLRHHGMQSCNCLLSRCKLNPTTAPILMSQSKTTQRHQHLFRQQSLSTISKSSMTSVPKIKLNDGNEIPILGLGTWKSDPGLVTQAVMDAIDIGYRHFDCALVYQNEKEVGAALQAKLGEGVVTREELFLTSKLWSTHHRPDLVVPALKQTLGDLGVEQLDLYLIHWPMAFQEGETLFPKNENDEWLFSDVDFVDTWKAMEECVTLGLTKSIGLSNFNSEQIGRILSVCRIKPVINQVECHPYLNQSKLIEFCKENKIEITAYSPLGSPTRPWVKPTDPKLLDEPVLIEIGKKHGKSTAQVALRWQIQRGVISIPKSVTRSRIEENFKIFDGFSLDEGDVSKINAMECNGRGCGVEWYSKHQYYPFKIEF